MNPLLEPHTAIFSGQTGCGKTALALKLLETSYKGYFDYIVVLCPTLACNKTYDRSWIWKDDSVFLIDPKDKLYKYISLFPKEFSKQETLFLIDDIIANEELDKKRSPLLELAISGRHEKHSLWLITQAYNDTS